MKKFLQLCLVLLIAITLAPGAWGQNVFSDGFETGNTDQSTSISGWTNLQVTGYSWTANSSLTSYNRTPHTGTWDAYLHWSAEAWLMKSVSLTGGTTYLFSAYAIQDATTGASIDLKYGINNTAAGMTNTILTTTTIGNTWQSLSGTFTPLTSGTYYVGIRGLENATPFYMSLDDISLDLVGAGNPIDVPITFSATGVTASGMTVNWVDNSNNETAFRVYVSTDNVNFTQSGSDIASTTTATTGTLYNKALTGLVPGTSYYFRIVAAKSNGESPMLTGTKATGAASSYTWNQTGTAAYGTAANWTPNRTTPDATDILIFDGTATPNPTVTGVATQTIGQLQLLNNANVLLQSSGSASLTISGGAGTDLDIPAGSTLNINSGSALSLAFSGTQTCSVAGTLTASSTGSGSFNFTNSTTTITGTLNLSNSSYTVTSSSSTLTFGATSNCNMTTTASTIPLATWNATSTLTISGITSATSLTNASQTFGNFVYNCSGATGTMAAFTTGTVTIAGNLTVSATNSGKFRCVSSGTLTIGGNLLVSGSSTCDISSNSGTVNVTGNFTHSSSGTTTIGFGATGTLAVTGNFALSNGTIDLASSSSNGTIKVAGTFNQSGGIITESSTSTGSTLEFNGSSSQSVTLGTINNTVSYRVNNNSGVTLTGTMAISNGAGLVISSTAATPITGTLTYSGTTTLTYNSASGAQTITANEFPSSSGPSVLTINNTATAPNNTVTLPFSRTLSGANSLVLTNGLLLLGNYDLTLDGTATVSGSPSSSKMVVINGTGQLKKIFTGTGSFTFPVGEITGTTEYTPTTLTYSANSTTRTIGVQVIDGQDPNDASGNNYISRYWVVTDNAAGTYTYTASFSYVAADIVGTESSIRVNYWNGSSWSQVGTAASNVLTISNNMTETTALLNNAHFTGRPVVINTYTWNGATSDYQVASNWTPSRTSPDPGDILQFNSGSTQTVINIPTQTIGNLLLSNNTTINFQLAASPSSSATLTIGGGSGTDLDIPSGSTLNLNNSSGTYGLTLAMGSNTTGSIAGTLKLIDGATLSKNTFTINATGCSVTIDGTIDNGGTVTNNGTLTFSATSVYKHNFTTIAGIIPTATWANGSTVSVVGYTTYTSGPSGLTQTFSNFIWNCPAQTATVNLAGGTITATSSFTLTTTNSGKLQLSANTSPGSIITGSYSQTGGTLDLAGGSGAGSGTLKSSGTFNLGASGTITESGSTTGSLIEFNGGTVQNVTLSGTISNTINYRINNNSGINLTGTIAVPTGAGLTISSTATTPISGTVTYTGTTTLTYNSTSGSQTITANEFPASSGPTNLTIANTAPSPLNKVIIPFNRQVSGTLTMTAGNIDLGANTLELGTTAAAPGTLSWSAGYIISGSFKRWFGTASITIPSVTGRFPFGTPVAIVDRSLYIGFSGAITTGGSITVTYNNASGTTDITSFSDGGITVDRRTNSNWVVANAIVNLGASTILLRLQGENIGTVTDYTGLRLIRATDVVGTSSAGTGTNSNPAVNRTTMSLTDIANTFYFGANSATNSLSPPILPAISIASGNWGDASTWDVGSVPVSTTNVTIGAGTTVTLAGGTPPYSCNNLTVNTTSTLMDNANTLSVGGVLANSGTLNASGGIITVTGGSATGITNAATTGNFSVSGGTVTLGPAGGGKTTFTNNGTLSVSSSGTLNINGNLNIASGSTFNQSGGNINIDGNAGGVSGNSVASGTYLLGITTTSLTNVNLTGGILTIVDPHASSTSPYYSIYVSGSAAGSLNVTPNHTIRFGNGLSTDAGGSSSYGFYVNTWASTSGMPFGQVIVTGPAGTNRLVTGYYQQPVLGDLTVNSGGEWAIGNVYVNGNLTVNSGGFFTSNTGLFMTNCTFLDGSTVTFTPSPNAQSISGTGTFRNASSSPTASLTALTINNSNISGVTQNVPLTTSGAMTISAGTYTIPSGVSLTIGGTVTNSTGISGLVVKSGGSLIQSTASVPATVERFVQNWNHNGPSNAEWGWHLLSSPVSAQPFQPSFVTSPPNATQDFYLWSEPLGLWINSKTGTPTYGFNSTDFGTNFSVGKGYLCAYETDQTKAFNGGYLNVGNFTVTCTGNGPGQWSEAGWNLLGNPYPCALAWNNGSWTLSNVDALAQVWNEVNSSYSVINTNGIIPAMQGFMVHASATSGSVTIPASARTHDGTAWYKSSSNPFIMLTAYNLATQTAQESVVTFDGMATAGYDPDFDSYFRSGYAPQFYSLAGTDNMAYNTLPVLESTTTIPFSFVKTAGDNFTIEAARIDNVPAQVYLTDLKLSKTLNLAENPVYDFTASDGDDPARFLLSFSHVGIDENTRSNNGIYAYENNLYVVNPGKARLEVYNLTGQKLLGEEIDSPGIYKTTLSVPTGYYVVRLTTGTKVAVTKVFIKS